MLLPLGYGSTVDTQIFRMSIQFHFSYTDNVRISENGTPGGTSNRSHFLTKYAFQDSEKYWMSGRRVPQSIWMRYPTKHIVAQIGFTPEWNDMAPEQFDVVGSPDCAEPWTTLLRVESAGFPNDFRNAGYKSWIVPKEARRPFRCIGLNVRNVPSETIEYVALKNLTLWEGTFDRDFAVCRTSYSAWDL